MTNVVFFYLFAGAALLAALMVVLARRIFHSALWLALCLIAVAGLFGLLDADFLAAAQILIYVGAVVSLMLFAIMLTQRSVGGRLESHITKHGLLPLAGSLAILVALIRLTRTGFPSGPALPPPPAPTTTSIGEQLLTTYVVPFEVASVLLVMAMIGAIVLARRDPDQ